MPDTPTQGEVQLGKWLQSNPNLKGAAAIRTEGLDCAAQGIDAAAAPARAPPARAATTTPTSAAWLGAPEVHADGEIWAQTLWSLRRTLIAAHGTGEGLARTREYVTDGLRLAPEHPSFLDMRNAIVQAAVTHHGTEDWNAAVAGVLRARHGLVRLDGRLQRRQPPPGVRRPAPARLGRARRRRGRDHRRVGDRPSAASRCRWAATTAGSSRPTC